MMSKGAAVQVPLWGIRAGRGDEAYETFTKDGVVALAWPGTPDLASLPDDREAFKQVYRQVFPERSDGNVVTGASQLYRFVSEAPYRFCHQRRVQWLIVPHFGDAGFAALPGDFAHRRPLVNAYYVFT